MKIVRLIFYVVSLLVIGEVTELFSLYRQELAICYSSDLEETPIEEDESKESKETKELEEDDDYFLDSLTPHLHPVQGISFVTPSLFFELSEPLNEITVPPPQG